MMLLFRLHILLLSEVGQHRFYLNPEHFQPNIFYAIQVNLGVNQSWKLPSTSTSIVVHIINWSVSNVFNLFIMSLRYVSYLTHKFQFIFVSLFICACNFPVFENSCHDVAFISYSCSQGNSRRELLRVQRFVLCRFFKGPHFILEYRIMWNLITRKQNC